MVAPALEPELREQVAVRLQAARQRLTGNREALVRVLVAAAGPVTMAEILGARPGLALSSAYRNLTVLEHAGIVHRLSIDGELARYELVEELTEHHHHLICASCGAVEDVPASAGLEQSVHAAAREAARRTGFRTHDHRVDLVGVCRSCT